MGLGRVVSAAVTAGAVCGCAALAVTMARAAPERQAIPRHSPLPSYSATRSIPVYRVVTPAPPTSSGPSPAATTSAAPSPSAVPSPSAARSTSTARSTPGRPSRPRHPSTSPPQKPSSSTSAPRPSRTHSGPAPKPKPEPTPKPQPKPHGSSLPLGFSTGSATEVVTVVAHSHSSTTATLQAWAKAAGGGWRKHGPAIYAHVGSQGLTSSPSEWKSATPIGSFSLTQAFGRDSDPGTALPYFRTDAADWWISQSGSLYNTHQHCWSGCSFTRGSPNEHLYYETPYYNYAVVIDTPSGSSAYPHGSAFFLHVSVGTATAGCVAIPQGDLVSIMRWLTPSAHPRILIGVT